MATTDSLAIRVRPLIGSSVELTSDAQLQDWISQCWDQFADEGPRTHNPVRRSYADAPWPENEMNLYVALYPRTTALNILDFEVFNWYTSSIQLDLIRDGTAELQYFYPEDTAEGVSRLLDFIHTCDLLNDNDAIAATLRSFDLPSDMDWVHDLEYNSAIVSAGPDGIEMVADSEDGYVTIIAIDG